MSRGFNPNDYDTVESRIGKFWADHPNGRILTDLVFRDDRQYIVQASVYTDRDDTMPAATGYAEEVVGSSPVNKTAALENCETSAVGRALANLNYATKARPSQTEMGKADRQDATASGGPATVEAARGLLAASCKQNKWDLTIVGNRYRAAHGHSLGEATDAAVVDAFRKSLFEVSDAELKAPVANGAAR